MLSEQRDRPAVLKVFKKAMGGDLLKRQKYDNYDLMINGLS